MVTHISIGCVIAEWLSSLALCVRGGLCREVEAAWEREGLSTEPLLKPLPSTSKLCVPIIHLEWWAIPVIPVLRRWRQEDKVQA